jgi:Spy/CpxP family protein refolding chaperone
MKLKEVVIMSKGTFIRMLGGVMLLGLMVVLAGTGLAQESYDFGLPQLPGKWWKMPRVVEGANLTPQQIEQIEAIFLEHRKNLIDLTATLQKAQLDFKALVEKDIIDRDAVMTKLEEISRSRAEIMKMTVVMQLDINEVLTPEQRTTLKKMRNEYRKKRLDRLDKRRDPHPAPPRR